MIVWTVQQESVAVLNVNVVTKTMMGNRENQWIETAWNEFSDKLLRFIRTKISIQEDAEDILQNIFYKVSTNIDSFEPNSNLNAWLFTITKNQINDYYRAINKNPDIKNLNALTYELEEDSKEEDRFCCLDEHINHLPAMYKEVIYQSEIIGLKHKEIAEKLSISVSGIKSRVVRGRELLKSQFVKCCKYKLNQENKLTGQPDCENSNCN